MKVICRGYKSCTSKDWCSHAKLHELKRTTSDYCFDKEESIECDAKSCCCDTKFVRKYKLEKIQNYG